MLFFFIKLYYQGEQINYIGQQLVQQAEKIENLQVK